MYRTFAHGRTDGRTDGQTSFEKVLFFSADQEYMRNSRVRNRHVYIFLIRTKKIKLLQKMSVRPSVRPCAKVMYTKTQGRVEIIECGFFLFERFIVGIETAKISTRTLEDFAISREPFDEIDS